MEHQTFQAFATAAWTGDASGLPGWFIQVYREAGASHVLAVSGQHVNSLIVVFLVGFRVLVCLVGFIAPRVSERMSDLLVDKLPLLASGTLLILSFFSASVLRSFVMVASFWLLYRRSLFASPLQKMGSSLAIVIIVFPERASEIGFLLSGAMTTWLILLRDRSLKASLRDYIWLGFSLSLLSLPLSVYFFGAASWAAPFWNLIIAPVWDVAIIPAVYAVSLLQQFSLFAPVVAGFDYCLKFFVEFHAAAEPWVSASYILLPRPNLLELLCVELWIFCVVSRFRNDAPSIDFS